MRRKVIQMEQKGLNPPSKNGRAHEGAEGAAPRAAVRREKRAVRHRRDGSKIRARGETRVNASAAASEALEAGQEKLVALGRVLEEQLQERPYVTLAAAVGVGVVLAQALSSRVGRIALLAAGGYAATRVVQAGGLEVLGALLGAEDDDLDDEEGAPRPDPDATDATDATDA